MLPAVRSSGTVTGFAGQRHVRPAQPLSQRALLCCGLARRDQAFGILACFVPLIFFCLSLLIAGYHRYGPLPSPSPAGRVLKPNAESLGPCGKDNLGLTPFLPALPTPEEFEGLATKSPSCFYSFQN